jgi:hypothetical protein
MSLMRYSLSGDWKPPIIRKGLTLVGIVGLVGGTGWASQHGTIQQAAAFEWRGVAMRKVDTSLEVQYTRIHHLPLVVSGTASNAVGPGLVAATAASAAF